MEGGNKPLEVVDAETGEVVPVPETHQELDPYHGISQRRVTGVQEHILTEKVKDEELDILPTGDVYLSQVGYRRRLNKAFGPGGWALVPRSGIKILGNLMAREYALFAEGRFISEAIGEQEYFENNPRMSHATAAESVKSNALVRCCKDLGIASDCWDRKFNEDFKVRNCEVIDNPSTYSKTKRIWVLKGKRPPPRGDATEPNVEMPKRKSEAQQTETQAPTEEPKINEAQRKRFYALYKKGNKVDEEVKEYLKETFNIESTKDIPLIGYEMACTWAEDKATTKAKG